jgi:hypothetical protein
MPATMKFHAGSPRGGIENGNKLGERPVVRQSKIYRTNESGNAMKGIFGQDHLAWDTNQAEGVFQGQRVFGAEVDANAGRAEEAEYPNPGSNASCDGCGEIITRFYHCVDCREETGLFDLCVECCGALYLKQGTPRAMSKCRPEAHPTHDFGSHRMIHVAAPGEH